MKIAVIGAGNVGGTLGGKWAQAGHEVVFGVRDLESPKVAALLETIEAGARAEGIARSLRDAEAVLLAVPWSAVPEIVQAHGEALGGKIAIDATNNFGAEVVNRVDTIREGARKAIVFRAFNSLGWEVFARPRVGETRADLFYCGPNGAARERMESLIAEVGLRPVRVGDLDQVQLVDHMGALWVHMAIRQGLGRRLAFKMMTE